MPGRIRARPRTPAGMARPGADLRRHPATVSVPDQPRGIRANASIQNRCFSADCPTR